MNGRSPHSARLETPFAVLGLILGTLGTQILLTRCLEAQVVPGGERGFSILPIPQEERDAHGFDPQASAGLFVGIHRFDDDPFTPVLFAADDAVDLAHLFALDLDLIDPPRVVLSLSGEPRKGASQERLRKLLAAGAVRKEATQAEIYRQLRVLGGSTSAEGLFVVAMATHGVANTDGDFLVSSDSLAWLLPRTGIAVGEIFSIVSEAPAPRRLVLLDACRERGSGLNTRSVKVGSQMSPSLADAISQASGQVVLFGATRGGFAYDDPARGNGVFAAAVIDGLSGQAPTDERYFITAGTLADYVQVRVVDWVRRNRPEHVGVSRGILAHLEGRAAEIPLAFDPLGREVVEGYRRRLAPALERLKKNIGGPRDPDNPITGLLYDEIVAALDTVIPTPAVQELLEATEALNGSVHTQRALAYVYRTFKETGDLSAPAVRPRRKITLATQDGRRRHPRQGDKWIDPVAGIEFVYVPPGSFTRGSPLHEAGRDDDETQHSVTLTRGFWMAATEVTLLQFGLFVAETGYVTDAEKSGASKVWADQDWQPRAGVSWRHSGPVDEELDEGPPVVHVSWNDAQAFAEWLSRRIEKQVRLPTEAQWEYAARAVTETSTYAGDLVIREPCGVPELDEVAWYCGNSGMTTQPVARKKANAWGLYDMLGNASEWVADGFDRYPEEVLTDPEGARAAEARVVRGGSAFFSARSSRAAARTGLDRGDHYSYLGFRVILQSAK